VNAKERIEPEVGPKWPAAVDGAVGIAVLAFVALTSLFALRNNDIWWHMAVGEELLRSRSFITEDPFTFTVTGTPWVPHSWLADIVFYLVHAALSVPGLIALRAVLVGTVFLLLLRLLRRLGVSLTLAAPVVLIAALNAQSRFILRPHLIEYLFVVLLLGYLVLHRERRGVRFFVFPVVLQLLWVNVHASYYMGVIMVVLFYAGEWVTRWLPLSAGTEGFLGREPIRWHRVLLLVVLMGVASFVNPSPGEFLVQPMDAEQRALLTGYTLEWQSPFDPRLQSAAFHPYYELLLVISLAVFIVALGRLKVSSLFLVVFFAVLSLTAHRFRVEFCLVAVPLVLDQLKSARVTEAMRERLGGRAATLAPYGIAVFAALLLVVTARDRIDIDVSASDRFPRQAFRFIAEEGVAQRSYHTIGHGSYLIWELYPERRSFIDGRNVNVTVHKDFLLAQTSSQGLNGVARKYRLDAFVVPAPEVGDGGVANLHKLLISAKNWTLAHIDRVAYVYVKNNTVPGPWLAEHGYRYYHPFTFQQSRFTASQLDSVAADLRRAVTDDSLYMRPLLDAGNFFAAVGDSASAERVLERALELEPGQRQAQAIRDMLRTR
jgi:hypothetical protein